VIHFVLTGIFLGGVEPGTGWRAPQCYRSSSGLLRRKCR
jgi:hypothetical protein